jgi:hypothetical protein
MMHNKLKTHMINVVHDEVVISMAKSEESLAPTIRWLMSDFTTFRCPITAGSEFSSISWGNKEEAEVGFTEPDNFDFMSYDVFNGDVFEIYK